MSPGNPISASKPHSTRDLMAWLTQTQRVALHDALQCSNGALDHAIIGLAGAVHCIVMHIPRHRGQPGVNGGLAPTAYLKGPNGGETWQTSIDYTVSWSISGDTSVLDYQYVDLSKDGGASYATLSSRLSATRVAAC